MTPEQERYFFTALRDLGESSTQQTGDRALKALERLDAFVEKHPEAVPHYIEALEQVVNQFGAVRADVHAACMDRLAELVEG